MIFNAPWALETNYSTLLLVHGLVLHVSPATMQDPSKSLLLSQELFILAPPTCSPYAVQLQLFHWLTPYDFVDDVALVIFTLLFRF